MLLPPSVSPACSLHMCNAQKQKEAFHNVFLSKCFVFQVLMPFCPTVWLEVNKMQHLGQRVFAAAVGPGMSV